MIHALCANKPSFQAVEFSDGLNVIVAERTKDSTRKDTRNGLGKSTLIEIIDFCLGSQHAKNKGLCIDPLADWAFTLDVTLAGNRVQVTRSVESPNRITVDGPTKGWAEQPDEDSDTGEKAFSLRRWRSLLGSVLFDLRPSYDSVTYSPSYRSLVSYFIRRGLDAYTIPFRHFPQQATWDIQLHVAYLLGLNWQYASRWQELRDQEKLISAFEKAVESGVVESITGTIGELEAERVQLDDQTKRERSALESFRVHPQYEEIQRQADTLTQQAHELTNANVAERRRLRRYEESVSEEHAPDEDEVEAVYKEAGFAFPDGLKRTLASAKDFHTRVIQNRKAFLQTEIERLTRQLAERDDQIRRFTEARAESLQVLQSHGAIEELVQLQERHAATKERLERVASQIADIKNISSRKRQIKVARVDLSREAEHDHEERRGIWSKAIRFFNDNSQALYESPGRLVIDISETGYKYDVEIQRSGSEGIGKMKVFCFDLMLLQLMQGQPEGIDFLVHDSVIFDGVDSRQRALALQHAAEVSRTRGLQYICTMNSDMVPESDFEARFEFEDYVRLKLTDREESGSLLGIRFQRPSG